MKTLSTGVDTLVTNRKSRYELIHKVSSAYHQEGEHQPIILDDILLGRAPECNVRFDESFSTVSRQHASIVRDGDNWKLIQRSKTNTTFLNGVAIQDSWYLQSGDEIQLAVNGPKLVFNIPSKDSPISLTNRFDQFKEQVIMPYKKAFIALCVILIVLLLGGVAGGIVWYQHIQQKELQYQNEVDQLQEELKDANQIANDALKDAANAQEEALRAKEAAERAKNMAAEAKKKYEDATAEQQDMLMRMQEELSRMKDSLEKNHNTDEKYAVNDAYLVVFSAEWCPPSKKHIKDLRDAGIQFDLVDIDKDSDLANQYYIDSYPTTILFDTKMNIKNYWVGSGVVGAIQDAISDYNIVSFR